MKNILLLLAFISFFLINNKVSAQCAQAESYVAKIQNAQDNWSPTKYASSGKQISAWTQFATWNTYKCQCDSPENLSDTEIPQLINAMNATRGIISKQYSSYGTVPRVYKVSDCKKGNSNSSNPASSKTSTQIEMENRFRNYNNAMNLKVQGENIAKAYAQQVKSYSELNRTNSPEALLQNFNNNMQAIADFQTQNKADNLNQLTNTLNSSLNDLNSGNYEGAMFSALSLLDQGEAKREARRKVEQYKGNLIAQAQNQMNQFYWKAVQLNDNAIDLYYQKAAYAFTKKEEDYLVEMVNHHECFASSMKNNFNYSNTSWAQNKCAVPVKKTYTVNNLIAKDIQYINAAKRKYKLYGKTGEPIFQQGAMRFAGLAATENPKAEYYYLMGHFAGTNNPLVAYSSFLTAESKNAKYFAGEKLAEFAIAKTSLELYFKNAIEENNQEVIKNIVGANLHRSVTIEGSSPIVYAIKIDQADVVYAFLNTELEGKPQSVITNKVQEVISMAAILDAPNSIQKFIDLGFSIDFSIDGKTPLDIAEESLAIKSFDKISEILGVQLKYTFKNSDLIKIRDLAKAADVNDSIEAVRIYQNINSLNAKDKSYRELLRAKYRSSFFKVLKSNKEEVEGWTSQNRNELMTSLFRDLINRDITDVYQYLDLGLVMMESTNLNSENRYLMAHEWSKNSLDETLLRVNDPLAPKDFSIVINPFLKQHIKEQKNDIWLYQLYTENGYGSESNIKSKKNAIKSLLKKSLIDYLNTTKFEYVNIKEGRTYYSEYKIDLLEFAAIERRDLRLVNSIFKNLIYDGRFKNQIWQILRIMEQPSFDIYAFPNNKIKRSNTISVEGVTEVLITKALVSNLEIDKRTHSFILTNCIKKASNKIVYNEYKSIIDFLISKEVLELTDRKIESLQSTYKQYKSRNGYETLKTDKKYWKAIMSGNYDKRY